MTNEIGWRRIQTSNSNMDICSPFQYKIWSVSDSVLLQGGYRPLLSGIFKTLAWTKKSRRPNVDYSGLKHCYWNERRQPINNPDVRKSSVFYEILIVGNNIKIQMRPKTIGTRSLDHFIRFLFIVVPIVLYIWHSYVFFLHILLYVCI